LPDEVVAAAEKLEFADTLVWAFTSCFGRASWRKRSREDGLVREVVIRWKRNGRKEEPQVIKGCF
jgi:hypothetical protein